MPQILNRKQNKLKLKNQFLMQFLISLDPNQWTFAVDLYDHLKCLVGFMLSIQKFV
jgi:hypothetical protein